MSMKLFNEFIRESIATRGKCYIFDHKGPKCYTEIRIPDNYKLVGTVDGEITVLLELLTKLAMAYKDGTTFLRDVIFCDAGGSKIQIYVDKDTIYEITHAGGIEEYAVMRAADVPEDDSVVADPSYKKINDDFLSTFEAADRAGQSWRDYEITYWEEIGDEYEFDQE